MIKRKEKQTISADKPLYTSKELKDMGYTYYAIKKLVQDGSLFKLANGIYKVDASNQEYSEFYFTSVCIPNGIICLMSAARYYGLTTYWPNGIDVAIERNTKATGLPDSPDYNIYYFSRNRFELGRNIIRGEHEYDYFDIYDIEKTVIDILFYRNKIGIEETKEVLTNYLKREDRDINKLYRYAKQLRAEKILRTYLEVLL